MAALPFLIICDFNAHGGTQTQVLQLLEAIDRGLFAPTLATLNLDSRLEGRIRELDLPVLDLGLRGWRRPATWRALGRLVETIRGRGIRLVHGFLLNGNLLAAMAGRISGRPYLTSVRNLDLRKRPHQVIMSRWAHGGASCVTFNSEHVRDMVSRREGIPAHRAAVIYNGLSPAPPPGEGNASLWPRDSSPRLLCAASFFPKKGYRYLLPAFERLAPAHPGAALLLAGEGPGRDEVESRVGEAGLRERVRFLGYREDLARILAGADLLLLASIEEGMPNVILEAMAAGIPQVATRVGGVPEAVEDGVTGFLVPPRDPVLMAERISLLLSSPELRRSMASRGRERFAERFSAARMAQDHQSLYESVIRGNR